MKIYDNGGATLDRYTVVVNGAVYGMSESPLHPQGFNQFLCEESEAVALEDLKGTEVSYKDVPQEVLLAIIMRLSDE